MAAFTRNDDRRSRGPYALPALGRIALVVGVGLVSACSDGASESSGDQESGSGAVTIADTAAVDASILDFCIRWEAASTVGDDDAMNALFEDPPAPIAVVEAANASRDHTPDSDEAALVVLAWIELACNPDAGVRSEPANRRIAPPLAATASTFEVCRAGTELNDGRDTGGGVVLYGDGSAADPFVGEMFGVFWSTEVGFAGDGTASPVSVRGVAGSAAPFTVFQQVVLDELGTVITWKEEGFNVGLFGRNFDADQIPELVAVAETLIFDDGEFELPADELPADFQELYSGSGTTMSIVIPVDSTYDVTYLSRDGNGLIGVSGYDMTAAEFNAFRFLSLPLAQENIDGRDVFVGNAWGESGPAVLTWRESDGLVVRFVGTGDDLLPQVRSLAEDAQDLDRDGWAEIVNAASPCFQPR